MDRLLMTTMAGLEEVAAEELTERFDLPSARVAPGFVEAQLGAGDLATTVRALNRSATCVDRVGIPLVSGAVSDLADIGDVAREADMRDWLEPGMSFAVRASRSGSQTYGSPEVAAAVGAAVIAGVQAQGSPRPRVDLDSPELILRADLRDHDLRIWVDTTGDRGLHHRSWRCYTHMASMRPTVANLLLRLAQWDGGSPLVDPLCGGGTIPIEAACRVRQIDPGTFRPEGWAWESLPSFRVQEGGPGAGAKAPAAAAAAAAAGAASIVGVERFDKHLQGAVRNVLASGMEDALQLVPGLAQRLDELVAPETLRGATVVTNPPFGRRVSSPEKVARLYRQVAAACARGGVARIATLTELRRPMREALIEAGYICLQERGATYGNTPVGVFVADRPG